MVAVTDYLAVQLGYPNDEALSGHPLFEHGLGFYGVFEVLESPWLKTLESQNRVSFPDWPGWDERHIAITFHDTIFECLATAWTVSTTNDPPQAAAVA